MKASCAEKFPTEAAHRLATRPEERRWLIESLWAAEAVGVVGGEPKTCKSFLALDMAVSVASGMACLGRFSVPTQGRVLLFAAEDALHVVRERLEGVAGAVGVELSSLDIQVITEPVIRLDLSADRERLAATVARLSPRLLVLDPFVRMHRVDENLSGDVAPLLAFLRGLQREHGLAVVVVHHAKKNGGRVRAGQALRGSSEFHAWGDSNLYLARRGDSLELTVEHRSAASIAPLHLELAGGASDLALRPTAAPKASERSVPATAGERVLEALREASDPLRVAELRTRCRMRTQTLIEVLRELLERGIVGRDAEGYRLLE